MQELNQLELVLGTKTRSGQQWDIWEAVFSPVGPDGYPARIWDKQTGVIDKKVAEYWRENYDLMHILKRDWNKGLGKKLEGKLNIYVGDMDNYYLNNAVYLAEQFLESTKDPVLRRRGALRRSRRALLERRCHAAQRAVAPALSPDVHPEGRGANAQDRAGRSRSQELALLVGLPRRRRLRAGLLRHVPGRVSRTRARSHGHCPVGRHYPGGHRAPDAGSRVAGD